MTMAVVERSNVIIFDCDGVLMDSNRIKEDVFASVTEKYFGEPAAVFIRKYHRENGGLSRFKKFDKILDLYANPNQISMEALCDEFESVAYKALLTCPLAKDLGQILKKLSGLGKHLIVLSGTPEPALTKLLLDRGLSYYFKEILGSPETKPAHIRRLHTKGLLESSCPFIFIGDSLVDQNTANEFSNCHFFWSHEFVDHQSERQSNAPISSLAELFAEAR